VKTVAVEDGVSLEVLDWGGMGPAVVLLSGIGNTGHVYDDFAPRLTAAGFHVYAVTRRGFGASSAPVEGYTFGRLTTDIVAVIDALAIVRPLVVGHSSAGEELNVLGREHASRVAGLVYLDAAVNRTRTPLPEYQAAAGVLPPPPQPTAVEQSSYAGMLRYFARIGAAVRPEGEIRATRLIGPEGQIGGQRPLDPAVQQAVVAMLRKPEAPGWEQLKVPALALFPVPGRVEDLMMPWYEAADPALRAKVEVFYNVTRERSARWAAEFRSSVPGARIVEVPGGTHYVFLSNREEVLGEIVRFASELPGNR
jgi:pimeloyl-ACP methyl ester carboxylesterase